MKFPAFIKICLVFFFILAEAGMAVCQVIDVQMHGYTEKDFGRAKARNGFESSNSAKEHLEQTIQEMDKNHIEYAVICGTLESIDRYTKADKRFLPGYQDYQEQLIPPALFEEYIISGKIKVFGEIMAVYKGKTLADSSYRPYLAICEKYGIPVAYHSGGSFPNAQNLGWPKYRIALGDPLLIEDVLVKYPKLKVYLMHAGENFYENALRMMDGYPNLYVDLGDELWLHPITMDYAVRFLKSAKTYGLLNRVMYGSDQMLWPAAISSSIQFLNSLDFLTAEEKQMILYKNARTFLGIKNNQDPG